MTREEKVELTTELLRALVAREEVLLEYQGFSGEIEEYMLGMEAAIYRCDKYTDQPLVECWNKAYGLWEKYRKQLLNTPQGPDRYNLIRALVGEAYGTE